MLFILTTEARIIRIIGVASAEVRLGEVSTSGGPDQPAKLNCYDEEGRTILTLDVDQVLAFSSAEEDETLFMSVARHLNTLREGEARPPLHRPEVS